MAQAAATNRQVVRDTAFAWEGTDKKGQKVKGRSVAANEGWFTHYSVRGLLFLRD